MVARTRRHQALLLGDVERGSGARVGPLPDQGENAARGGEIFARDPQPVLRLEDLEIGGGDADDRGENHDLLVEALHDGAFLRGARCGAVLAPEIDFVAGVEHRRV